MVTRPVAAESNLFDYFHDRVSTARSRVGLEISRDTELYLTTLLTERARADRPAPPEETLAELHGAAAAAPPARQARQYRELGDRALYLLGYFAESLSRRLVGPSYYADMGTAAYHRVDILFKVVFADAFGPVFRELAEHFHGCARLITDVRDMHREDEPADPMVLYHRWLQTGDPETARALIAQGLLISPTLDEEE